MPCLADASSPQGQPDEPDNQRRILAEALRLLEEAEGPSEIRKVNEWPEAFGYYPEGTQDSEYAKKIKAESDERAAAGIGTDRFGDGDKKD